MSNDINLSSLCLEFGISRPTGYKWKKRFEEHRGCSFKNRSKSPPNLTEHQNQ